MHEIIVAGPCVGHISLTETGIEPVCQLFLEERSVGIEVIFAEACPSIR